MNKLFTVLGRKFKFSAQDSDLGYLCWRCKNSQVSSDLKPPLEGLRFLYIFGNPGLLCAAAVAAAAAADAQFHIGGPIQQKVAT